MSQAYSDPRRASDPHALPDVETFYVGPPMHSEFAPSIRYAFKSRDYTQGDPTLSVPAEQWESGWYWQPCFPGCLPDGEPIGPFATEAEALADSQQGVE